MNEEVLDAVRWHIDAYNRRDIESLLDGFASDAVLKTGGRVVVGLDNIHALFTSTFAAPWHSTLHITSAVVQDGTAACEMTETLQSETRHHESELVGIYTVHSGRIVRARLYRDHDGG
jgi:hypothetical protein